MEQRAKLCIKAHGIEPAEEDNIQYGKENDARMLRDMAWAPRDAYTAPVNIYVYGNKTGLISYGEEVIGTIIESPQIAEAMRQIFALTKRGVEALNTSKK